VSGQPSGATVSFSPASITNSGSSTLTITALAGTTPGNYPLTITATSGALSHTSSATLTISPPPPPPDFTVSATPSTQTVGAGSGTSYTVTATAQNGFTGSIGLAVSGQPTGATVGFTPASISNSGSSVLSITTLAGTTVGTYPLTITATSGALSHTASASLVVTAPGQTKVWNSYDVVTQAGTPQAVVTDTTGVQTATVELYESLNNFGVDKGTLFPVFNAGAHPGAFNHVQGYWANATGGTYPYGGKSTVGRGSDTNETNAPAPSGVFDLQMHPNQNDHLVVAAFKVPENGTYQLSNLATRRVDGNSGQSIVYMVFSPAKVQLSSLRATSNQAWVIDPGTYNLGQLSAGDYVYFGVNRDGLYSWDATEISWKITENP
jgi:hypothetical protein